MVAVDLNMDNSKGRNRKCCKWAEVDNESTVDKGMGQSQEEDGQCMDSDFVDLEGVEHGCNHTCCIDREAENGNCCYPSTRTNLLNF